MRKRTNLNLAERMIIVIIIVFIGAMIVSLTTGCSNEDIEPTATETTTETQTTEIPTVEGPKAKEGFFAEDDYVRQYEDGDVYWEWQIEGLSEDAKIIVMNGHMQYICVQEGHEVWLIDGRDDAQLIAENGEAFSYPFHESGADGYIKVEDGVLYFQRLYPFNKDGQFNQVELADGVEEIIGHRGFVKDGKYWYLGGNAQGWEEGAVPTTELGSNPIIRRDLERLRDYDMSEQDFNKKYGIDK